MATFLPVTTWRSQQNKQTNQTKPKIPVGWAGWAAAWGRFLPELGWGTVCAAHCRSTSDDSGRQQWVGSGALLKGLSGERFVFSSEKCHVWKEGGGTASHSEQKPTARYNTKKVHNGSIEICVEGEGGRERGYCDPFQSFLLSSDAVWEIRSCEVKHASSLSHELLNMYLFFFITSVASDSNYLANKGWSPYYKGQPLKEGKLHAAHSGRLSWNSIISFILCVFQASPNKTTSSGANPQGRSTLSQIMWNCPSRS